LGSMMRSVLLHASLCGTPCIALALVSGAGPAMADDLFARNNVGVLDRSHPDYEAIGIRAGSFIVYPRISADGEYDSNIFAEPKGESDYTWSVTPSIEVDSDWNRNSLSFNGSYEWDWYASHPILNATAWKLNAAGSFDVTRALTLSANGGVSRDIESKTSPNTTPGASGVVTYTLSEGHFAGVYQRDRTRVTLKFDGYRYSFNDVQSATGSTIDQTQRDHGQVGGAIRLDYAFSPNTAVFAEAIADERRYDDAASGPINRNSTGLSVLGGWNLQLGHLVSGEIGLGYLERRYVDPAAKSTAGLNVRAKINWYATPLLTATFTGGRSVEDSGLPNVAAYVDNEVSGRADYEILRNLILSLQIQHARFDYVDIDRHDDRTSLSFRASYLFNHYLGFGLTYSHLQQRSTGGARGPDYGDDRVALELIIQR